MSERPILLQADHLKKWFPVRKGVFSKAAQYVKAVDDVSLVIREGETLGIVGESGCGKSTLARTMMRLIEPALNIFLKLIGADLVTETRHVMEMRTNREIVVHSPDTVFSDIRRLAEKLTGNTIGVCIFMAVYSEIVTIVLIHTVVRGEP